MSDFFEDMNESHGAMDAMGNIAAISQRNNLLAAQKKQLAALKEQSKIDKSRANIENQRLEIEKKRLVAEEAEREYRRQQDEQIKQLRNLLADSVSDLDMLAKQPPFPRPPIRPHGWLKRLPQKQIPSNFSRRPAARRVDAFL